MERYLDVFPECYVDSNLVGTFLGGKVNHKHSCNEVAAALKKVDGFGVGIIDNDKRKPTFVNEFELITKSKHLSLLRHGEKPLFLVIVSPAMDGFILDLAADAGLTLPDYSLPCTLEEFKKITKQVPSSEDPRFRRLFQKLNDQPEAKMLRSTLKYLVEKKYAVLNEDLYRIFNETIVSTI